MHLTYIKCTPGDFCSKFPLQRHAISFANARNILMKASIIAVFTFLSTLLYAHDGHGQVLNDKFVSMRAQDIPLKEILKDITRQTGIQFSYKSNDLKPFERITYQANQVPLTEVLDELLVARQLQYEQLGQSVVIKRKAVVRYKEAPVEKILLQELKGRVVDESGRPIAGVNVRIKGLPGGTTTDINGHFTLQNVQNYHSLIISSVGYKTREIAAASSDQLSSIVLEEDMGSLDEVLVIGYGTTTRRLSTGSTAGINAEDIANQPINNVLTSMQGRIAGLEINSLSGMVGSNFSVRIRGVSSIESGNDPLYIIDGVPFFSEPLNGFVGANGQQNPLNSINPSDIERVDVLKDADATAIYGSRGANGVILITTKRGKAGRTETSFNVYSGIGQVTNQVDMLSTPQYLALRREAYANDGLEPSLETADLYTWDQQQTTDWQDLLIGNTAKLTEAKMSVSGGNELTTFLLSGTYRHETTTMPSNDGYDKGAGFLSVDHTSADRKFNVMGSVSYTADVNNSIPTDLTQYYNLSPNMPIYDDDGNYYWYGNAQNPIAYLDRFYRAKTNNLIANGTLRFTPIKSLDFKVNLGYTDTRMNQLQTLPEKAFNPASAIGSSAYYNNTDASSYIIEPQVNYTLELGKGQLQLLLGGTWQQSIRELRFLQGGGYASDAQLDNIAAASELSTRDYRYSKYKYQAVFGRVNYNWEGKYIVNATFRRDGSSRFGDNRRFGNFGAVGAAWVFSEESWTQDHLYWLSFGKLRASYGITGNDQIGDYQYLDSWDYVNYPYNNLIGLTPARVYNPDYGWESNKKLEFGLELGFLKDRISFTGNYYRNRSDNQLLDFVLSPQTGFDGYITNLPALIQNKGWEFELHTVNFASDHFSWSSSFNATLPSNKLLEYPDLIGSSNEAFYKIGEPLTITKGYHFVGVDPATGISRFEDLDSDGNITAGIDDQYVLGSDIPAFYGGFQNSLGYKNFQLDFLFQFVKQEGPQLNYGYSATQSLGLMANFDESVLGRWITAGQNTDIPRASVTSSNEAYTTYSNRYRLSSAYWDDASFIRLKNVSLRYNLTHALSKLKVHQATVYLQGNNLFTITNYKGFDPETRGMVMPPIRMYTLGLQFTL